MNGALCFDPGSRIKPSEIPTKADREADRARYEAETEELNKELYELAFRLYAENKRSLLLILQGMDTSGKDGTIRKVMSGINPLICQVSAFGVPSAEELDHDFLWRIHKAVPRRGNLGIFNRSQYEDVLVVRVKNLAPEKEWKSRYDRINEFEKLLTEGGMKIIKVYLHISKDEQKKRLEERLKDPAKSWKFRAGDLDDRKLWGEFQDAYEDALTKCNTKHAPWYVVPADNKWYRNALVSKLLVKSLKELDPKFPPTDPALATLRVE